MIDAYYYAESMELSQLLLTIATAIAGLFVFAVSVCRLRFLHQAQHQRVWVQAYALIAFGAAGMAVECWIYEVQISQLLVLVGTGLWLWGSRVSWQSGPPKYLERKPGGEG